MLRKGKVQIGNKHEIDIEKLILRNEDDLNSLIINLKHKLNINKFDNFINDSLFEKDYQKLKGDKKPYWMDKYNDLIEKTINKEKELSILPFENSENRLLILGNNFYLYSLNDNKFQSLKASDSLKQKVQNLNLFDICNLNINEFLISGGFEKKNDIISKLLLKVKVNESNNTIDILFFKELERSLFLHCSIFYNDNIYLFGGINENFEVNPILYEVDSSNLKINLLHDFNKFTHCIFYGKLIILNDVLVCVSSNRLFVYGFKDINLRYTVEWDLFLSGFEWFLKDSEDFVFYIIGGINSNFNKFGSYYGTKFILEMDILRNKKSFVNYIIEPRSFGLVHMSKNNNNELVIIGGDSDYNHQITRENINLGSVDNTRREKVKQSFDKILNKNLLKDFSISNANKIYEKSEIKIIKPNIDINLVFNDLNELLSDLEKFNYLFLKFEAHQIIYLLQINKNIKDFNDESFKIWNTKNKLFQNNTIAIDIFKSKKTQLHLEFLVLNKNKEFIYSHFNQELKNYEVQTLNIYNNTDLRRINHIFNNIKIINHQSIVNFGNPVIIGLEDIFGLQVNFNKKKKFNTYKVYSIKSIFNSTLNDNPFNKGFNYFSKIINNSIIDRSCFNYFYEYNKLFLVVPSSSNIFLFDIQNIIYMHISFSYLLINRNKIEAEYFRNVNKKIFYHNKRVYVFYLQTKMIEVLQLVRNGVKEIKHKFDEYDKLLNFERLNDNKNLNKELKEKIRLFEKFKDENDLEYNFINEIDLDDLDELKDIMNISNYDDILDKIKEFKSIKISDDANNDEKAKFEKTNELIKRFEEDDAKARENFKNDLTLYETFRKERETELEKNNQELEKLIIDNSKEDKEDEEIGLFYLHSKVKNEEKYDFGELKFIGGHEDTLLFSQSHDFDKILEFNTENLEFSEFDYKDGYKKNILKNIHHLSNMLIKKI